MAYDDITAELERRIAIIRDNLRTLIEQATAKSGAADESLVADRIAKQEALLADLTNERSMIASSNAM